MNMINQPALKSAIRALLVPPLAVASLLLQPVSSPAQSLQGCSSQLSGSMEQLFNVLGQSSSIEMAQLNCPAVDAFNNLDFNDIELTTSRHRGKSVICMTVTRESPCQYRIAFVNDTMDASSALKDAFGYQDEFDPNAPLEETVARLFIKPSKYILKVPDNVFEDIQSEDESRD